MKKIVIVFGLISGVISSLLMWLLMGAVNSGTLNFDNGMFVGYATMIIALSLVFFGIKSYRDNNGGQISFVKGLQVGILITIISALCYAVSWEIYYPQIGDEFIAKYTEYNLDKMKTNGAPAADIEAARVEGEQFGEMYKKLPIRFAFSIIEILPVGIIVTLLSAALLRKREILPMEATE